MECASCHQKFCWICLAKSVNGVHPLAPCEKSLAPPPAAAALPLCDPFSNYWDAFRRHAAAERQDADLVETCKEAGSLAEPLVGNALLAAGSALTKARRVVKHSYVYAWRLLASRRYQNLEIFKQQQSDLERHLEELSRRLATAGAFVLESDFRASAASQPLLDATVSVSRFVSSVSDVIEKDDDPLLVVQTGVEETPLDYTPYGCDVCHVKKSACRCCVKDLIDWYEYVGLDRPTAEGIARGVGGDFERMRHVVEEALREEEAGNDEDAREKFKARLAAKLREFQELREEEERDANNDRLIVEGRMQRCPNAECKFRYVGKLENRDAHDLAEGIVRCPCGQALCFVCGQASTLPCCINPGLLHPGVNSHHNMRPGVPLLFVRRQVAEDRCGADAAAAAAPNEPPRRDDEEFDEMTVRMERALERRSLRFFAHHEYDEDYDEYHDDGTGNRPYEAPDAPPPPQTTTRIGGGAAPRRPYPNPTFFNPQRLIPDVLSGLIARFAPPHIAATTETGGRYSVPLTSTAASGGSDAASIKEERPAGAADESEIFIQRNFIKCPSCHVPIERNAGCDHMSCKCCGTQFCYKCGALSMEIECPGKGVVHSTRLGGSWFGNNNSAAVQRMRGRQLERTRNSCPNETCVAKRSDGLPFWSELLEGGDRLTCATCLNDFCKVCKEAFQPFQLACSRKMHDAEERAREDNAFFSRTMAGERLTLSAGLFSTTSLSSSKETGSKKKESTTHCPNPNCPAVYYTRLYQPHLMSCSSPLLGCSMRFCSKCGVRSRVERCPGRGLPHGWLEEELPRAPTVKPEREQFDNPTTLMAEDLALRREVRETDEPLPGSGAASEAAAESAASELDDDVEGKQGWNDATAKDALSDLATRRVAELGGGTDPTEMERMETRAEEPSARDLEEENARDLEDERK